MPTGLLEAAAALATPAAIGTTLVLGAESLLDKPKTASVAAPTAEKPTLMPDPIAQMSKERRKASIMASQQMTRAATILTPTAEKLGG